MGVENSLNSLKKKLKIVSKPRIKNIEQNSDLANSQGDEVQETREGNKKKEKLKNKKISKTVINEVEDRTPGVTVIAEKTGKDTLQPLNKIKKRKGVKRVKKLDEFIEEEDVSEPQNDEEIVRATKSEPKKIVDSSEGLNEVETRRSSGSGKSKKSTKRKKSQISVKELVYDNLPEMREETAEGKSKKVTKRKKKSQLLEKELLIDNLPAKREETAEDEVYQMSSGDEDSSKGMKKWMTQYHQSRPGLKVLQERIDDFIMAHEEEQERIKEEKKEKMGEDGWTVVEQRKGRKKTTEAESGVAVGSVSQTAVLDKMANKKNKDVGLDFYRFQKREAHRSEIMMLQSKFEQDKKQIQQMRAERKFRPY